jgi:hypothetical protein
MGPNNSHFSRAGVVVCFADFVSRPRVIFLRDGVFGLALGGRGIFSSFSFFPSIYLPFVFFLILYNFSNRFVGFKD